MAAGPDASGVPDALVSVPGKCTNVQYECVRVYECTLTTLVTATYTVHSDRVMGIIQIRNRIGSEVSM